MKTTTQRLEQYRAEALSPKWVRPLTWRDTKQHHASAWGAHAPNSARVSAGQIYSDSLDQYGQDLGAVGKLFPRIIDHNGWYADNSQNSLVIGHVVKLRCPRGTLYIPATENTGCDGTVHYIRDAELVPKGASEDEHEQAQREAARSADHYAEREADECREYDAKDQAEQDIQQARKEIHETNAAVLALAREMKQQAPAAGVSHICQALHAQIKTYLKQRADCFRVIEQRTSNFWSAVEN